MRLSAIHRYPVKSCRGESLPTADVEPWGLAGDRRWMLVDATDPSGGAVTAREVNRLLLITPQITPTGLRLSAPGHPPLDVDRPDPSRQRPVSLWRSTLTAAVAERADVWLARVAGRPLSLVWLDDPTRRPTDELFSEPGDRVSFADGYPLLVTTEASLAALNDEVLGADGGLGREPLPMSRFRPNLVLSGTSAWEEDDWRRLRIGGADGVTFRAVKGCARCVMTTIDPDTAEREREPLASLARLRRFDGGTWFGVNLIPELSPEGGRRPTRIDVGADVEVLERVPSGAGPLRSSTVA